MNGLKRTVLYDTHKDLGAKLFEFGGWEMPLEYEGMIKEHESVRNNAGLFDVSHMGEVIIQGKDAEKFIQNLVTNDLNTINNNEIIYTPMCYENGNMIDDLLIYKFNKDYSIL